jgi:hypothetical protein
MADRGWELPVTGAALNAEELAREADRLGYSLAVVRAAQELGFRGAIESVLVPTFLDEIDERIADVIRSCVVVATGRSGRPHGTTTPYPGEGVLVFMDGSLLLMFADIIGHAVSLVTASTLDGRIRYVVESPDDSIIRAVASIIWSFRQPSRGFNAWDLPHIGTDPYSGEPAFGKFLWFGERFLIGHEFAHALFRLGQVREAPGIRKMIRGSVEIPREVEDDWVEELSADIIALNLVAAAADEVRRPVAVASCLLAASFLGLLERTVAIPPWVPFPLAPTDVPVHLANLTTHPPEELRSHLLTEAAGQSKEAIEIASVYQSAVSAILIELFNASDGQCIAPLDGATWCANERGPSGWFCEEHGRRH